VIRLNILKPLRPKGGEWCRRLVVQVAKIRPSPGLFPNADEDAFGLSAQIHTIHLEEWRFPGLHLRLFMPKSAIIG